MAKPLNESNVLPFPTRRPVPVASAAALSPPVANPVLPYLSLAFFLLLLLTLGGLGAWAWFGTLEESVPGVGQMVPDGKLRRIMSPMGGTVAEVYVKENQHVKAGQRLLVLEPDALSLQKDNISEQLGVLQQENAALQAAFNGGGGEQLGGLFKAWLQSTRSAYQAELNEANRKIDAARHAYQQALAQRDSAQTLLKSKEQQLEQYRALYDADGLSEKDVRSYEEEVMSQRGMVLTFQELVATRKAELEEAQIRPKTIASRFQQQLMDRATLHQQQIVQLNGRADQADLALKRQEIVAPVDGVVNEQAIHGQGEVITAGAVLMTIVPDDAPLVAEVKVTNRDLSYIKLKQRVTLRIDAFPYQRFGKLMGTIEAISPSTHMDPEGNPFFAVRIRPDRTVLKDEAGHKEPIRSGMSVQADIKTREKSILSFFTEPMHERFDRAFKEPSTR